MSGDHKYFCQAPNENQGFGDDQNIELEEGAVPPHYQVLEIVSWLSPMSDSSETSQSSSCSSPCTTTSHMSSGEDTESTAQESLNFESSPPSSPPSSPSSVKDLLRRKVNMLTKFVVQKYKFGRFIKKADMLNLISKRYEEYFPEILRRVTVRMDLVLGLDLKELTPGGDYQAVAKFGFPNERTLCDDVHFPNNGLLMPVLSMILMNGDCVTEKKMWKFLNILGVYDGEKHFIYGEPRKLITRDFVFLDYLRYERVSKFPPRYVFKWGPKAHEETSKMQVLEYVAKASGTVPTAFPSLYEEALRDAERRARATVAARRGTNARVRATFNSLALP